MLIRALQAAAGNFGVTGYAINDSLRFNDNDSAYLSRTPATAGNRKTFTWSGWVKRGNLSASSSFVIFQQRADSNVSQQFLLQFRDDAIRIIDQSGSGGTTQGLLQTTAVFRDVSGWYHIVVACDTTDATAGDRVKLYVNGVRVTSFSAPNDWPLNYDTSVNNTVRALIGTQRPNSSATLNNHFDGYMAEVNFIDGQALTADDFGQIDATTGEWSPKRYSGTYGTNGFYLPFDGNANDDSGNGNNWTENNLASTDYMLDTPTNNFATFNPLTGAYNSILEGNLVLNTLTASGGNVYTTINPPAGKWYLEFMTSGNANGFIRITGMTYMLPLFGSYYNGSYISYPPFPCSTTDVCGVLLNFDDMNISFNKNGGAFGATFSITDTELRFGDFVSYASSQFRLNFGADSSFAGNKTRQGNTDANGIGDFYYEPPAGFLALCEDNLETLPFSASGGTETTITDGGVDYKVHTFTSSDTFTVTSGSGEVEYLVVAGGGSGGYEASWSTGAGGAGGLLSDSGIVSVSSHAVTVGAGGAGSFSTANNGGNSVFGAFATAIGGGRGGGTSMSGSAGGSGGGGGGGDGGNAGGAGTPGQGFAGGTSTSSNIGGGGGGAGGAGVGGGSGSQPDGGACISSSITGTPTNYAGGGGGGIHSSQPANNFGRGACGIGGDGGNGRSGAPNQGKDAVNGTGSGGGGGGRITGVQTGSAGSGGSGIVIIRYAV